MAKKRKAASKKKPGRRSGPTPGREITNALSQLVRTEIEKHAPSREDIRSLGREFARLRREVEKLRTTISGKRPGRPPSNRKCSVKGCDLPHTAKGFCSKHYQDSRRKAAVAKKK